MRKYINSLLGMALLLFSLAACQTNETEQLGKQETPAPVFEEIPAVLNGVTLSGIMLPNGTVPKLLSGSEIQFTFPEDVLLVMQNSDGTFTRRKELKYECTCTTTGCDVFYVANSFGCSACNSTCTGKYVPEKTGQISPQRTAFIKGNRPVSLVLSHEEAQNLMPAQGGLFEVPEVRAAMLAFNEQVYGNAEPNLANIETVEVPVDVFGNLVIYTLPVSYLQQTDLSAKTKSFLREAGTKYSCKCTTGQNGKEDCIKDGTLTYKKCKAGNCVTCQMTVNTN